MSGIVATHVVCRLQTPRVHGHTSATGDCVFGTTSCTGTPPNCSKVQPTHANVSHSWCFQQEAGARNRSRSSRAVSPKVVSRKHKDKHKYVTDKQTTEEKVRTDPTSSLPAGTLEYPFGQRLKDAQRVEDLFEVSTLALKHLLTSITIVFVCSLLQTGKSILISVRPADLMQYCI